MRHMCAARTTYHHGDLESALLAEAVAQVRERGVEKVSLRGLAQAVGVSPSAAYQHFPDKAALLTAVGTWAFAELWRRMRERMDAVTLEGDAGAVARFGAIGATYVSFAVTEPHLFRHKFGGQMVDAAPKGEHAVALAEQGEENAHSLLLAVIADLAGRGLLRPGIGTAEGLDMAVWSLVHGFSWLAVEGHLVLAELRDVFVLLGRMTLRDEVLAELDLEQTVRESGLAPS
jgi:AcrR family transcriptional regulator